MFVLIYSQETCLSALLSKNILSLKDICTHFGNIPVMWLLKREKQTVRVIVVTFIDSAAEFKYSPIFPCLMM